jgi:hypothetical protein
MVLGFIFDNAEKPRLGQRRSPTNTGFACTGGP